MPALGRRAEQSRNFLHLASEHRSAELSEAVVVAGHHIWGRRPGILDQGDTGTCEGHSGWYRLAGAPFSHIPGRIPGPLAIYDQAILMDQWTDNDIDPDRQLGTSTVGMAKALVKLGFVEDHYDWVYDVQTASKWIAGRRLDGTYIGGPLSIGINWYDSMFDPDPEGFVSISPRSPLVGRHALNVDEDNSVRGFVGGPNSWGTDWGNHGRWRMSYETFDRLLREDGEALIVTEKRGSRPAP
jgi:hypothetical protein